MSEKIPAIGDWLIERNSDRPGLVVAVLPMGDECVLASRPPPNRECVEGVHKFSELRGPMNGRRVKP